MPFLRERRSDLIELCGARLSLQPPPFLPPPPLFPPPPLLPPPPPPGALRSTSATRPTFPWSSTARTATERRSGKLSASDCDAPAAAADGGLNCAALAKSAAELGT